MPLVTLIVTGETERLSLGKFLEKIFPDVTFETERVDSFTSGRIQCGPMALPNPPNNPAVTVIDKFVTKLIAAIDPGRNKTGPRPDIVVGVDDLELYNLDQPGVVVEAIRAAVQSCVVTMWPSVTRQTRCLELLKKCASFHVLSPMAEAYFFTDENALRAANVRSDHQLVHGKDLEDFESSDPKYLSKYHDLKVGEANAPLRPNTQSWFAKHPKEYLKHLLDLSGTDIYRESVQGASALRTLSPVRALEVAEGRRFLRSFVRDLADALDFTLSGEFNELCHPETSRHNRADRILRNI